jgi:hypothetical protein
MKKLFIALSILICCSAHANFNQINNVTLNGALSSLFNESAECTALTEHDDLTHHWRFENNLNDSVTGSDEINLTNSGTLSYSSGDPLEGSYTLELDGVNNEAAYAPFAELPTGFLSPPLTICLRARTDTIDQVKYFVSQHDTGANERKLGIQMDEDEKVKVWHSATGEGPSQVSPSHPYQMSLGEKIALCYTEDSGANYTLDLYSITSDTWTSGSLSGTWSDGSLNTGSAADFYIGGRDGSTFTHDGGIDDVMIFKKILNTSEKTQYFTGECFDPATGDIVAPTVTIAQGNTTVGSDLFLFSGTCTDANEVILAKYRLGGFPSDSEGTVLADPESWVGSITGLSLGTNNLYVGCKDASGNWGYDSVSVYYIPGGVSSPTGIGLLGGTNFESTSLGSWQGIGSNAYKVMTDTFLDDIPFITMNVLSVCDEANIDDYHDFSICTPSGATGNWFCAKNLTYDYPNRMSINSGSLTDDTYDEFYVEFDVRIDSTYLAANKSDTGGSWLSLVEAWAPVQENPFVIRIWNPSAGDVYFSIAVDPDQVNSGGVTVHEGTFIDGGTYQDNYRSDIVAEGDTTYHIGLYYKLGVGSGGIVKLWVNNSLAVHYTGDTGNSGGLNGINFMKVYGSWLTHSTDQIVYYDNYYLYDTCDICED